MKNSVKGTAGGNDSINIAPFTVQRNRCSFCYGAAFTAIFCGLSAFHTQSLQAQEKASLIGHWAFNEGEGVRVADSSGQGNHGAIVNEIQNVKWVEGRVGKALAFAVNQGSRNENGCVVITNMNKYDFGKGITIEAWIRLDKNIVRNGTYEIVSNTESDRGKGFRFCISWNALAFISGEGGTGKTWGASSNPSRTQIKPETWYHVAGTYDGSIFRVYLDGEEVGASEPGKELTKGRNAVSIGAYVGGNAYGFEGLIDEIKIYNFSFAQLDIMKHAVLTP